MNAEAIFSAIAALLSILIWYVAAPKCPNCNSMVRWVYATKKGRPDRRYKNNYQLCGSCGWTSLDNPKDEQDVQPQLQPEGQKPAVNASTKLNQEAEKQRREARLREETARLQAEEAVRRKATEAAILRQAEEERQRKEQEEKEVPHKLVLWLFKYIATADRRFSEGEQDMVSGYIRANFALDREAHISKWVKELSIEPLKLESILAPFKDASEEVRKNLFQSLQEMSVADGKATKAEKERLLLIQRHLGLFNDA